MKIEELQTRECVGAEKAEDGAFQKLRRFGMNLADQAKLRASYAAAIAAAVVTFAQPAVSSAQDDDLKSESFVSSDPELPPLVPIGAPAPKAGGSMFLTRPEKAEGVTRLHVEQILGNNLPLQNDACDGCLLELRCPEPKILEDLEPPPIAFRPDEGGTWKLIVPVEQLRGGTWTLLCRGEDVYNPDQPGGWQLTVPALASEAPPIQVVLVPVPELIATPLPEAEDSIPPLVSVLPPDASPRPEIDIGKDWAVSTGALFPVASTHGLLDGNVGAYLKGSRDLTRHVSADLGLAWSPVSQALSNRHPRFTPRNSGQRLRGNAYRATAGINLHDRVGHKEVALDLESGVRAGVLLMDVNSGRDVAVDSAGALADFPGTRSAAIVTEASLGLRLMILDRAGIGLHGTFGVTPTEMQLQAGEPRRGNLTYTQIEVGVALDFE